MVLPDGRTEPLGIAVELSAHGGRILPVAFDTDERWPADPDRHVVTDQQFCLSLRRVDEPVIRLPADLLRWMDDLIVFVRQQLISDTTPGGFPGPEWPHGEHEAYALHIVEQLASLKPSGRADTWDRLRGAAPWPVSRNAPCHCGSGNKFKKCCLLADSRMLSDLAHQGTLTALSYAELKSIAYAHAA